MGHTSRLFDFFCEFTLTPFSRNQAGWPVNHHYNQDDTEDKFLIFGRIQLIGKILPGKVDDGDYGITLAEFAQI